MEYYFPLSDKEFSQKKLEEYDRLEKIINKGRKNPIWFIEEFFGIQLIDYQKWMFMESWYRKFILWLCCRRTGKTSIASVFLMAKMLLFPNCKWYISANSGNQSVEIFNMLKSIALKRVPSFSTCTDIFAEEVAKTTNSRDGFIQGKAGSHFRLYNDSELETLTTNLAAIRGMDGSVLFDETAWQTEEQMAAIESYAARDTSFTTGISKFKYEHPKQMPLQLLYASSAGDVEFPFYTKYKNFAMKMFEGNDDYFVCDLNANTVLKYSTIDGEKCKSHVTQEAIDKAIAEDPDRAEREWFNKFRRGGGQNAVVKMEILIRNSEIRVPLLKNDTGNKKFIFCYDPARNFDGSVLSIYQIINYKKKDCYLQIENSISMVDPNTKKKTPLPMTEQLEIIKDQMIKYNGVGVPEWENIIGFYIDAGSGGGGISAVADQLMADWKDQYGHMHRGMIDPEHKQYETARLKHRNAAKIIHLLNPQSHKKIIYDALEKMSNQDLIKYTDYDGKEFIVLPDSDKGEFIQKMLTYEERAALVGINLLKTETSYMCRYDNPNGSVQYELAREKRNTMHDDRA